MVVMDFFLGERPPFKIALLVVDCGFSVALLRDANGGHVKQLVDKRCYEGASC